MTKIKLSVYLPQLQEKSLSISRTQNFSVSVTFMIATRHKRILIVEDNPIHLRLLGDILMAHGYEIAQAVDGLEAIDLAWASPPDLILMDLQLRDVSGLEIVRRLRNGDGSKQIPIIAVTALAQNWVERTALDSGCDGYLSKPISIRGLLDAIEPFLAENFPLGV